MRNNNLFLYSWAGLKPMAINAKANGMRVCSTRIHGSRPMGEMEVI